MTTSTGSRRARRPQRAEWVGVAIQRALDRWLSPFEVWIFRRTNGRIAEALILTTRGRRSGRERAVVLRYFPDGDAMILAAANDGGRAHPGWYFNLTARPEARVEVRGRTLPVRAEALPAEEAVAWWQRILRLQPSYARYERATTRVFPIVRLVPAVTSSTPADRPEQVLP